MDKLEIMPKFRSSLTPTQEWFWNTAVKIWKIF